MNWISKYRFKTREELTKEFKLEIDDGGSLICNCGTDCVVFKHSDNDVGNMCYLFGKKLSVFDCDVDMSEEDFLKGGSIYIDDKWTVYQDMLLEIVEDRRRKLGKL
jgi:hypothetical protein